MSSLKSDQAGFTLFEVILFVLMSISIAYGGYTVWESNHKSGNNVASSTGPQAGNNGNAATDDMNIQADLASIGQAISNIPVSDGMTPARVLPSNLNKLHLSLNNDTSTYPYKILVDKGNASSSVAIYEVCADFNTNTFDASSYTNNSGAGNNPGSSASSYALHSSGEQCFTNSLTESTNGVDLIPNTSENRYRIEIMSVDNQDWATGSGFKIPSNLSLTN